MKSSVATAVALVLVACAAPACLPLAYADDSNKTIKDLKSHDIPVHKDAKVESSIAKAMDNYRRFLELQKTDPELRAEAMRRLGDLKLDSGDLERMEKEVGLVDLQSGEAIKLYSTLLKAYPNYSAQRPGVVSAVARLRDDRASRSRRSRRSISSSRNIRTARQLDEVQFRRGELLFSAKRYPEAEQAYAVVIQHGKSSDFYEQSLYKHGWSLFKQSMTDESLSSFAGVLDLTLVGVTASRRPIESLKRADRELVEDTLRVMSIAFSYGTGAGLDRCLSETARRGAVFLPAVRASGRPVRR